ncbi:hypothetical protein [Streptomyces acidiscabies]|uniref:hypothetical protein n=1 Tax=Streptomyces acidiscabies TaxID=42234 RepID=UPI0038F5E326
MSPESGDVALELSEPRRTMEVGFTEQRGSLALIVQRGDQTDRRLADHEERLDALERNRWPVAAIGMLTGVIGAATGALSLLTR